MDEQTLKERLATTWAKTKISSLVALVEDTGVTAALLHEVCYDEKNDSIAFRAAWMLEYIAARYPERFIPVFGDFMIRLPNQRNPSCQRHFTKILMDITHPEAPKPYKDAYSMIDREQVVETVFGWLVDPQTPVAVQANCLDILFNMSSEFGWIAEELEHQVEFLLRNGSAAMQSRGKKILARLKKSKPKVYTNG